jgi:hypothetical protein
MTTSTALKVFDFVMVAALSYLVTTIVARGQELPPIHGTPADPYPHECCNLQDCAPISPADVQALPGGAYRILPLNQIVPADRVRPTTHKMVEYSARVGEPTPYHLCARRDETRRMEIICFFAIEGM